MKRASFMSAARWGWQRIDYLTILLVAGWSLAVGFTFPNGTYIPRIWSDAEGYYAYLPAVFIYQSFEDLPIRSPYQFPRLPETNRINLKTTCGVAMLEAPFFGVAHLIARNGWFRTKDTTGFGKPYSDALIVCAIFYLSMAFLLLRQLLRQQLPAWVVALTLAGLYWGTNLFFYTIRGPGMSHVYSFFANTAVIVLTQRAFQQPRRRTFAWLGLALGLAVLIRPTNIFMALFPLAWKIDSVAALKDRARFIWAHASQVWVAIPAGLVVFLPQLAYWRHISGKWVYYSYGDEGFIYWKNPHLLDVYFGVIDGLLVYSPLLVLGLIGLIVNAWTNQHSGRISLLILALGSYAISSWWAYQFGASFGHRAFIDYFPLFAIGWATLIGAGAKRHRGFGWLIGLLTALGMYYSVQLGYIYAPYWSESTWSWEVLWRVV
jgi:hypothetical protein